MKFFFSLRVKKNVSLPRNIVITIETLISTHKKVPLLQCHPREYEAILFLKEVCLREREREKVSSLLNQPSRPFLFNQTKRYTDRSKHRVTSRFLTCLKLTTKCHSCHLQIPFFKKNRVDKVRTGQSEMSPYSKKISIFLFAVRTSLTPGQKKRQRAKFIHYT